MPLLSRKRKTYMPNIRTITLLVLSILIGVLSVPLSYWQIAARYIGILRSPLRWLPSPRDQVVLHFTHNSLHYATMGSPAWDNLLPPHPDAHLVHTQDEDNMVSTQTVALFHQLRCIEILHRAYVEEGSHRTSDLAQHCLNYIRQSVMCQSDMTNEPQGATLTANGRESLCRDWESVYREAGRNHEAYERLVKGNAL